VTADGRGITRRRPKSCWLRVVAAGLSIALAHTPVFAQTRPTAPEPAPPTEGSDGATAEAPTGEIESMVVVGRRYTGVDFDAPQSVTSFDKAELIAIGAQNISDVAAYTPNLEIRNAGATSPTFFIRGVGLNDFTANAAGAVAIYQDEVALNLPAIQLGQLFDMSEVNVLRGPQGSGAGRNASAGAIKIASATPTGQYSAFLRSELGNYDHHLFEGALEAPVVENIIATRVAFQVAERDPFLKNGCANAPAFGLARVSVPNRAVQPAFCGETTRTPFPNPNPPPPLYSISNLPTGLPERLNDRFNWAARGQLRITPPETGMDWLLNVHGGQIDQLATLGQTIGTGEGYFGSSTAGYRQPEIAAEEDGIFDALGGNALPPTAIAERTAVREQARQLLAKNLARRLDVDPFRGDYNRAGVEKQDAIGTFLRGDFDLDTIRIRSITAYDRYIRERDVDGDYTPNVIFENIVRDDGWQVTQDLNMEGDLGAEANWNVGGYYLHDHLDYFSDTITGTSLVNLKRIFEQESDSIGAYAGVSWDFLDDFTLDVGARYNWEEKRFDVDLLRSGASVCPKQKCNVADRWDAPTGTLSLRYHFSDDVSSYLKYSRGWKGAQYNAGGASGVAVTVADPESIDAWETGLSGRFFRNLITAEISLFYYNYRDYQVFLTQNDRNSPPQRIVINAHNAQVYGSEIEGTIEPIRRLLLAAHFSWLESEFLDFSNQVFRTIQSPQPPPVIVPVTIDYTGNRLPNTPEFKLSFSAEYTLDLGRFGSLVPRYDYTWTDDIFFDPSDGRGLPNDNGQVFMPKYAIGQRHYGLHNVRIAYRSPMAAIEVAFYVRNLTDEVYKTLAFDASSAANIVGNLVGDPRTYGVSFSIAF
jgi:iron complex outermembrane receptor protein